MYDAFSRIVHGDSQPTVAADLREALADSAGLVSDSAEIAPVSGPASAADDEATIPVVSEIERIIACFGKFPTVREVETALIAAALWAPVSWGEALVLIFFLLVAGPATAHAMGSAAHRIGLPRKGYRRDDLADRSAMSK